MNKLLNKYKNMGKEAKAGLWFVICNFLQKGINFIVVPIFTRLMSTEQYGLTTLYNTWVTIFLIFATLNISGNAYIRGLVEYEEKKFTSIVQFISLVFSIFVVGIILLFKDWFLLISGLNLPILICMCFYLIFEIGLNLWSVKERFNYRYKKLVIVTLLNTILSTLFALIAVICFKDKGTAKILASTITMIIIAIPFYIKNFVDGKSFFDKKIWKYVLLFSLPLIPHYLSNLILNNSDKIMINLFCGKADVAFYGVAYSIGSILLIFTDSVNTAMTPWRYNCLKENKYKNINNTSLKILILVAIMVIVVNLFAPEILRLYASKEYYEAVWVIPPIMLSIYFIFLYNLFSSVEFYYLQTKFMMIASVLSAILNILLNYILIGKFGYIACAYTTLLCYILYCIGHYLYMKYVCRKNIGKMNIYNSKYIIIISIICSIITLLSSILYSHYLIRYLLIIITCSTIYINRMKIIKVLKEVKK